MLCPCCENFVPNGSNVKFCPTDGTPLLDIRCARCGLTIYVGQAFCTACGEKFPAREEIIKAAEENGKPTNS